MLKLFQATEKLPSYIQLILFPQYHWMYSATAYNHAYNDSGIFCIHASSHPQSLVELTQVGCCCWNNLITAERKMIRAGIGARVSGDNRKNLSGGIGQSEDTGFVPNVRLICTYIHLIPQLKSMLLMNLESRPVIFEDCARQV